MSVQPGSIEIVSLTEHGKVWRDHGGVILDATASVAELKALRPDASIVDIAVSDAADATVRLWIPTRGLSRTALSHSTDRREAALGTVIDHIRAHLRRLAKRLGRDPKTLIVTHRPLVAGLRDRLPAVWRHYGNTRGYDEWFQEGYDCFVTIGDPFPNVRAIEVTKDFLGLSVEPYALGQDRAAAEAAQAHGRARSVQQRAAGSGVRLCLHYGRVAPLGWDKENATVEIP